MFRMQGLTKHDKMFIGIILLVHVVFYLLARHFTRIFMGDSFEYIYEAVNIKDLFFFYSGNPALPIEPEYMTQRQPVYPLFLLGVYSFSVNNWIVLVLQNIISVFNLWYARSIFISMGFKARYDWLLLMLLIAYPAQFINANTIAPDIILQSCALLYFGNFVKLCTSKSLQHALYMSLWLVIGLLVKPVFYPFVAVHLVVVVSFFVAIKSKLQRPVLVALIPLCAVLLYNYSNYTRTGKFHFSSNQAFNAIYYYTPYMSTQYGADSAQQFLKLEREHIALQPDFKSRYEYANARGMELLKAHSFSYLLFHFKHSVRIFIEPGKAEMDLFTGKLTYGKLYSKAQEGFYAVLRSKGIAGLGTYCRNNPSLLLAVIVLLFNCLRLLGFVLFLRSSRVARPIRLFVFILVGYFASAAGPIANTRYFLPVSVIVAGCAVIGFVGVFDKRKEVIE